MDQDTGDNTDKRNWREKLGIGKTGAGQELPKIADAFKPSQVNTNQVNSSQARSSQAVPARPIAQRPSAQPNHSPVKVAPMAPRIAQRPAAAIVRAPVASAPSAPPPRAAVVTDVSVRSTTQRVPPIAAEVLAAKLKEQRDAAEKLAIQRVAAAKQRNDFTQPQTAKPKFAFADPEAMEKTKPAASAAPSIARPPQQPTPTGHAPQNYPQPYPNNFSSGTKPVQPAAYRPVEPPFGNPQPTNFNARQSEVRQQSAAPLRPNNGVRPVAPSFQPQSFQPQSFEPRQFQPQAFQPQSFDPRGPVLNNPRNPQMPMPQNQQVNSGPRLAPIGHDDVFEDAAAAQPRGQRRATANEYQQAYQDEMSDGFDQDRPRAIGWIVTVIILALLVALGGWGYMQLNKSAKVSSTGQNPPAIEAPTLPAKVLVDPAVAPVVAPEALGKKQIYDRIEGDREIPAGPLKSSEQSPNLPAGTAVPPPQTGAGQTGGAVPLPLPPPPAPGGQQGAIGDDGKTDVALITPAAEPSSAANSSLAAVAETAASGTDLPMPSGTPATTATADVPVAKLPTQAVVQETPPRAELPKKIASITPTAKPVKALGADPVVLVPPSSPVAPVSRNLAPRIVKSVPDEAPQVTSSGGGLYGDVPVNTAAITPLALKSPAATSAGYQVQLASFATREEASAEYQRLSNKHGAIITRYAPLIQPADVAGSTRYRLSLGPMASNEVAQSVCGTLISAGERDCLVHR